MCICVSVFAGELSEVSMTVKVCVFISQCINTLKTHSVWFSVMLERQVHASTQVQVHVSLLE